MNQLPLSTLQLDKITDNKIILENAKRMRIRFVERDGWDMIFGYRASYNPVKKIIKLAPEDKELPFVLAHEFSHATSDYLGLLGCSLTRSPRESAIEEMAADSVAVLLIDNVADDLVIWHCNSLKIKPHQFGTLGLDRATRIYNFLTRQHLSRKEVGAKILHKVPKIKALRDKNRNYHGKTN